MANNQFIKALFTINRKDRALAFIVQALMGACNLVCFMALGTALIIFRNNLSDYRALMIYLLYGFYMALNLVCSWYFYFYLKAMLNTNERRYFKTCFIWGAFGINFFTSLTFYFKSGLSKGQKRKAIAMIKRNRVQEILDLPATQAQLNKADQATIATLFEIAKNHHESLDNVHDYILELLNSKKISTQIKIKDSEVVKWGYVL